MTIIVLHSFDYIQIWFVCLLMFAHRVCSLIIGIQLLLVPNFLRELIYLIRCCLLTLGMQPVSYVSDI